jgi:hypothetical protein
VRAGFNDPLNPFIGDELVRRLMLDMGHVAAHGTFVNLFLNGQYKGYYNPTERINSRFLRAWHGGTNDWDVIEQRDGLRLGKSGLDPLMLDQTANLIRQQRFPVFRGASQLDGFLLVPHSCFSSDITCLTTIPRPRRWCRRR